MTNEHKKCLQCDNTTESGAFARGLCQAKCYPAAFKLANELGWEILENKGISTPLKEVVKQSIYKKLKELL